jgi:hypothetical protein
MRSLVGSTALLRDSFLIALFRSPRLTLVKPSLWQFAVPVLLLLMVLIVVDWLSVSSGPRAISSASIKNMLLASLPIGVIAWMLSREALVGEDRDGVIPDLFGQIFVRLILVFLLYLIALKAINLLDVSTSNVRRSQMILFVWFVLCASKALAIWAVSICSERHPLQRAGLIFVLALFLLAPGIVANKSEIWIRQGNDFYEPTLASDITLNNQALLLQDQLALIKPQRPGVVDLYFIGFAPDASEDVFKRELETIHPLMDQRFDTAGRSLRLLNHSSSLATYPVATVAHLRTALKVFGQKMDPHEDVLVLYLTAHGSREHSLISRFFPMQLEELNPQRLKNLLDASGLRNRVLVVSACFSGGFIEPLADQYSLVMTASSKDKTSFGCGNDSDFTFFGKALFDEQLRLSYSFEQAFKNALPTIAQREQAIGVKPSDPQIAVGAQIIPILDRLTARLKATERN